MADPADEDPNKPELDDAEPGAQVEHETPGDTAEARPAGEGDEPEQDGDDSTQASDPLALAQQEPAPEPKPAAKPQPAAKPEPAPKPTPPKPEQAAAKPSDPPASDDKDLDEALADIPAEDWKNGVLSHKAKSVYLSQKRTLRKQADQIKESQKAKQDLEAVEKFRTELGLEPEEWVHGATLTGALKRGDPRAIPVLEQHLANLRKRTGAEPPAPPQPTAPSVDLAEILSEIEAAEANFDFDRLAAVKAKLAGAKAPAPAKPPQQAPAGQPRQQAAPPQAEQGNGDEAEFAAIGDALSALGVQNPVDHVRSILTQHPDLAATPPGQRLKAIVAKHRELESAKAPAPRPAAGQPLSGRGGPVRRTVTTNDPLKHAIRR